MRGWRTDTDPATAELFPNAFNSDGLPQGWRKASLGLAFKVTMGQSPPGDTYNEAGVGTVFFQGRAEFGVRFPTPRLFCTAPTRFAQRGDILLSVRAPVGDVNLAPSTVAIGRGLAAISTANASPEYAYQLVKSLAPTFAVYNGEGTVFGSINKDTLLNLTVIDPPDRVVSAYEAMVRPMSELIESNTRESCTLEQLRDSLLPKLLSGEMKTADTSTAIA